MIPVGDGTGQHSRRPNSLRERAQWLAGREDAHYRHSERSRDMQRPRVVSDEERRTRESSRRIGERTLRVAIHEPPGGITRECAQ